MFAPPLMLSPIEYVVEVTSDVSVFGFVSDFVHTGFVPSVI